MEFGNGKICATHINLCSLKKLVFRGLWATEGDPALFSKSAIFHEMNVIALTIFISLALALLFVAMFIGDRITARSGSLEQDSLLPLDDGDDEFAAGSPPQETDD